MGKGYGNILGIIIAAGVFAAGLKAAGVVDMLVEALTSANHLARIGGAFGPYLMGVLTGSGDAAAFAFNEAVTPNAAKFGLQIADLGLARRHLRFIRTTFFSTCRRRHSSCRYGRR